MRPTAKRVMSCEAEPHLRRSGAQWCWWFLAAVLLALSACLYSGILARLVQTWWNDPNYSHGFFVPLFSAYVVWSDRKRLARIPLQPSWWGVTVVAVALFFLIAGVLGAALFLSRWSFIFLLAGLVIYFLGWRFFRAVLFPWAVLILMIPIPAIVFNHISLPLQLVTSRLSMCLLSGAGVAVLQTGNIIHLPAMSLEVADACSGIRGLVSLGTVAIIYGYRMETKIHRRVILGFAAVPIAVLANAVRVSSTGLIAQYWGADKAQGFFHEFSGWAIFVLSLGMLFLVHRGMGYLHQDEHRGVTDAT